jgi:hypothetical protein
VANNPLTNIDPTGFGNPQIGTGQGANAQNAAICQGGYLTTGGGLTFRSGFFNTWDEFGSVVTTNTVQSYYCCDENGNWVPVPATTGTNTWNIGSGGQLFYGPNIGVTIGPAPSQPPPLVGGPGRAVFVTAELIRALTPQQEVFVR